MSADGKIADKSRSAARFASPTDQAHLEKQVSLADAVLFGAGTLRAYGTTLPVSCPQLLQERTVRGQTNQPIHIVCSHSGIIEPTLGFFQQSVPRWLLTTAAGKKEQVERLFEKIIVAPTVAGKIDWNVTLGQLSQCGIGKLAVLGGGNLVASLVTEDLIDELWLTICPLILGGSSAPTPVDGIGLAASLGKKMQLLSAETLNQEVFLHYRVKH